MEGGGSSGAHADVVYLIHVTLGLNPANGQAKVMHGRHRTAESPNTSPCGPALTC